MKQGSDQVYMANFGASFKKGREARGLSLAQIADETRISTRFLGAIESENFHLLPGGIFNRSFIRAYAKFIGYDENEAIEDYARTLRERGDPEEETPKHRAMVYTDDSATHARSRLFTLLLAVIILAALSLAVWAGLYFYQRSTGQKAHLPGMSQLVQPITIGRVKEVEHDFTV